LEVVRDKIIKPVRSPLQEIIDGFRHCLILGGGIVLIQDREVLKIQHSAIRECLVVGVIRSLK
jgi:hypothetical protein